MVAEKKTAAPVKAAPKTAAKGEKKPKITRTFTHKKAQKPTRVKQLLSESRYGPTGSKKGPKTLYISNMPKTASADDVRKVLQKFKYQIKSVRLNLQKPTGKKAIKQKGKDGKILRVARGGAFVTFDNQTTFQSVMKRKMKFEGKPLIFKTAAIKKAHVKKMATQTATKEKRIARLAAAKVAIEKKILQVQKSKTNKLNTMALKRRKAHAKPQDAKKTTTKKVAPKAPTRHLSMTGVWKKSTERRGLSGFKARKAMAHMSRA